MRTRASSLRSFFVLAGLSLVAAPAAAVAIDWVAVGDPGNAPDTGGFFGSVANAYAISKYEVTNAQYAEFLNAKAASDPLGLWDFSMGNTTWGGIRRSGSSGSYTYLPRDGFAAFPVNYVSFYDTLRFANWLNNGQGNASTETGAYTLLGGTQVPSNGTTVQRNENANVFLPSENEWFKAAYYDSASASYFSWPTGSNTPTTCANPTAVANHANCGGAANTLTVGGAYSGSASPYGTFDQGGNVWEWNEQKFGSLGHRGIRGGSVTESFLRLHSSHQDSGPASGDDILLGFRVASVPEPGTSLLVLTGLAGLAARRRRLSS